MQTLEERKAAIMAKAEKELRNAEIEHEIREAWPLQGQPRFVHVHTLYRSVAGVKMGDSGAYAMAGPTWTVKEAVQMAACFDEVGTFLVRDGCWSIRPTPALQDVDQDRAEVVQIEPYRLRLDYFGDYLEFHAWIGDHLCRVEIAVKDPDYRIDARYRELKGRTVWDTHGAIYPRDYFTRHIKHWSSGDQPASFTLYST